jgi:hypothetical protein
MCRYGNGKHLGDVSYIDVGKGHEQTAWCRVKAYTERRYLYVVLEMFGTMH